MYTVFEGDLPPDIFLNLENQPNVSLAIDTETLGLITRRDRLCLVQISTGNGTTYLIHFAKPDYTCPHLKHLLSNENILKIFHYARFDMAALQYYLNIPIKNVYCTKIASKLSRTYSDKHGYATLCRELLGVDLDKKQQTSNWANYPLSTAQKEYASNDAIYLHAIKNELDNMLIQQDRMEIAQACFKFLPTQVKMDLLGWPEDYNIFSHNQ